MKQDSTGGPTDASARLSAKYRNFIDIFREPDYPKLPKRGPHDHSINLKPGKQPSFGKLYPMSAAELEELRRLLDKALVAGTIRRSSSSAASPVMFVPKVDGSLRLVVDYRHLNDITIKNSPASD
jgi:hypothetical protein